MRISLAGIIAIAGTLAVSDPAWAQDRTLVAGWDFSQYGGSASLVVDFSFANTYTADAQWSDLDLSVSPPTNPAEGVGMGSAGIAYNMGAGAGAFGRMYHDGSFGSTNTSPGLDFRAATGNLLSNQDAPTVGLEMSTTGAGNVLVEEGQAFANDLRMQAIANVDVVFEADKDDGSASNDWEFSFAGVSEAGDIDVSVQTSTDGSGFAGTEMVTLTSVDTQFVVDLGTIASDIVYVRLGLVDGAFIDNVAVSVVPEPSAALAAICALSTLAAARRFRG